MRILFDQGTPRPLRQFLVGHEVRTSAQMGWSQMDNGTLLAAAEGEFDALITTDKNLRYQQNLQGRRLSILVLPVPDWSIVRVRASRVLDAVNIIRPGEYREISW